MNRIHLLVLLLLSILVYACNNVDKKNTRISFCIYAAQNEKVYLYKIPFSGEKRQTVDSAIVNNSKDSIIFTVPVDSSQLYEIEIKSSFRKFDFVPDVPYIKINGNNITGKYTIEGSESSKSIQMLYELRARQNTALRKIQISIDSVTRKDRFQSRLINLLQFGLRDSFELYCKQRIAFADTVRNPIVFMLAYNENDFGNDHTMLKNFITRTGKRFKDNWRIQELVKSTLSVLAVYEKEYYIGDSLPAIVLPDKNGFLYSTSVLKGKYYLIDFWSTWCTDCFAYNKFKKQASETFDTSKFQIVSVALDDHKQQWEDLITRMNYNWVQLIDEKMWTGTAAQTLAFDSIPFNFLVSPGGRIIAKAIKPDSLMIVLGQKIK